MGLQPNQVDDEANQADNTDANAHYPGGLDELFVARLARQPQHATVLSAANAPEAVLEALLRAPDPLDEAHCTKSMP